MAVKYVATTGNNGNAGTIGSPWLTPRYGIGQLAAGDTLYIRGGTYSGSGTRLFEIYFSATGTSWGAGQITVSSYPGETATLVVEGGGDNLVRFQDGSRSYIELVDLVLDGTGGMEADSGAILVYCASTSTRIRLTGVEVKNSTGTGLLIEGSFHEFINCNVHGNGTYAGYTNSNGLYCSATDCLIEGGEYWDNEAYGFRFGDSSGSHDADRNVARNVLTYQNGLGVGLGGTSTATGGGGIVVADNDNLVANCISDGDYAGIVVFGLSGKTSERNKIYNCTIHGTVTGYAIEIQALGVDTEVKNCLCYNNAVNAIEDDGTTSDLSNNLDDGTDPQFIDAGAGDFHLEADSPAINAGLNLSPDVTDDFDGGARPFETAYDIGAFEHGATGSPGSPGSPGDSPSGGEFAFIQADSTWNAVGGQSSTASPAMSVTAGNALIVAVRCFTTAVTGVTDTAGNDYSLVGSVLESNNRLEVWAAFDITGHAANIVTATFSPTTAFTSIIVCEYSGLDAALGELEDETAGTNTITSDAFDPTAETLIFVAFQVGATPGSWTGGSGYTLREQDSGGVTGVEDRVTTIAETGATAAATHTSAATKTLLVTAFSLAEVEEPEPEPEPSPGPGPGESTIGVNGIIEMCFHRGTSFRTWIKYRGGGITAKRFWWLGDVGTVDATDDMHEEPLYGAFGTYEFEPIKVRGLIPEYGLASWFDGAAQRVTTLTGLSGTGGIFTLIACIRPDAAGMGTARCIYQTGAVGSGYLGINDDDQPVFGVNGGTLITSSQTLEADHEYLLVGTYDGSSGTIFAGEHLIDATIYEDGPTALTFTAAHDIGTIGSNESTEYFTGAIQHVAELEDTLVAIDVEGLHSNTFWTDVTPDVEGVLTMDRGIHDDGPLARIAATGQLRITMDNSTLNTAGLEGYYSPNHANVREGFQRGIPIRFSLFDDSSPETRLLQFIGTIKSIRPTPGIYLERRSAILATDWMDEAARSTLRGLPVMTGVTADQVVEAIINGMRNRPHEIDFNTGSDTYEIALHNTTDEGTTAMVELRKVSESELGFVYVLGDGTLVFESRSTRALLTLTYSLTDFLTVEQDDSADLAKNRVKVTVHPARVGDDPTQVLYSNDSTASPADPAIALDNGMNIEIFFPFRDLGGQETERIGATEIIEPVETSDYLLNTAEDGSGGDVTGNANITLTWALGGNGVYLRATNGYGQRVWFTFLQIRGRAVYDFEPIELIARNDNLRDEIGEQLVRIDMPYQTQGAIGQGAADYLLNAYSTRQTRLKSVTFWGDYSGVNRVAMIYGDISTRIAASEDMSGVAGEFYINAKRIEWKPSGDEGLGDIDCTFHLADTQTAGEFWVLETSALDVNTRLAYL